MSVRVSVCVSVCGGLAVSDVQGEGEVDTDEDPGPHGEGGEAREVREVHGAAGAGRARRDSHAQTRCKRAYYMMSE